MISIWKSAVWALILLWVAERRHIFTFICDWRHMMEARPDGQLDKHLSHVASLVSIDVLCDESALGCSSYKAASKEVLFLFLFLFCLILSNTRGPTSLQWELTASTLYMWKSPKVQPGGWEKRKRQAEHLLSTQPRGAGGGGVTHTSKNEDYGRMMRTLIYL